jgi:hypothetical protein
MPVLSVRGFMALSLVGLSSACDELINESQVFTAVIDVVQQGGAALDTNS